MPPNAYCSNCETYAIEFQCAFNVHRFILTAECICKLDFLHICFRRQDIVELADSNKDYLDNVLSETRSIVNRIIEYLSYYK